MVVGQELGTAGIVLCDGFAAATLGCDYTVELRAMAN